MKHLMLDLETMGNRINPVIVQISAVQFDIETGETGKEFTVNVNQESSAGLGLEYNDGTVAWWDEQSQQAKDAVFKGGIDANEALEQFSLFVESIYTPCLCVWGNGIRADNVWLDSAYKAAGKELPFQFWQDSDVRTIVMLGKEIANFDPKSSIPFEGVKHNAIDDCKHQIKYVSAIYNKLKDGFHGIK